MKLLKLVFAVAALAIAFGAPIAKAQDANAKKPSQSQAEKDRAAYSLTDDQFKKVDAIYKDAAKQKKAIPNTDPDKKAKDSAITDASKAKVRAVLTAEQQAKFDEANKKGGKGGGKDKGKDKGKGDAKNKNK